MAGEYENAASAGRKSQKGYYSPLALPPALRDRLGQGITSPQKPAAVLPRAVMPVHGTGRVRRLLLVGALAAASELRPPWQRGAQAAVDAWVADGRGGRRRSISGWDTSRVTTCSSLP